MLIRQRTVAAGVGVDLGPIQRHRAQFQHAHLTGQFQNLDKQRFDFLEEPTPECRYRVVVGVVVRRDEAKRHRIVGRPLQLAARKHAGGIAIDQHAQKRRRRIRGRTGTSVGLVHCCQIEAFHHLHHKARQVSGRQPLVHRRRHQVASQAICRTEIAHHRNFTEVRVDAAILHRLAH